MNPEYYSHSYSAYQIPKGRDTCLKQAVDTIH